MISLYYVIQEMHSFSMRPAKYFYDKPLPKHLDPKTVLIYRPHPVYYPMRCSGCFFFVFPADSAVEVVPLDAALAVLSIFGSAGAEFLLYHRFCCCGRNKVDGAFLIFPTDAAVN